MEPTDKVISRAEMIARLKKDGTAQRRPDLALQVLEGTPYTVRDADGIATRYTVAGAPTLTRDMPSEETRSPEAPRAVAPACAPVALKPAPAPSRASRSGDELLRVIESGSAASEGETMLEYISRTTRTPDEAA